jgi:signal transduction histidine kinase
VLRVADTGSGIPQDELPRLFDRFYRVQNARARSNEGSGIGLALVRELVGLHRGTIHARRETALAALGQVLARAASMTDTLGEALAHLHRLWHASSVVGAIWADRVTGLDAVTTVVSDA